MKQKRPVLKPKTNIWAQIFIVAFAIAFIIGIALLVFADNKPDITFKNDVILYNVNNVKQLEERLSLYKLLNEHPLQVEPYLLKSFPKDFAKLPSNRRKQLFIKALIPIAVTVNAEFEQEHAAYMRIYRKVENHEKLSKLEKELLSLGLKKYKCKNINELVIKSGGVPISLLIAQAGIESGWGKSRFAIHYNNLFGIHKKHPKPNDIVMHFRSLYDATKEYILNLDRSPAYKKFRLARFRMGDYPNPYKLAEYLSMYSTKRHKYINLIKQVIASNNLEAFDRQFELTRLAEAKLNLNIFE